MIVVTGGAGFIGSALIWKLNSEGVDDIIVVDSLGTSDKWKNLVHKRYDEYIDKNDFIKMIGWEKPVPDIHAIVHLGACSATTERDADYLMRNNSQYTIKLAQYALRNNIRFIYAGSAATYGGGEFGYSDENGVSYKLRPQNMYGYSKQFVDMWAIRTYAVDNIVGLKFFNVYGPNEYHKGDMSSVIYKSFHQINENGKVKLFKSHKPEYKDGEQKRDFVYIKDVVNVIAWLLEKPKVNGIFNVGSGKARTWKDLTASVFQSMNKPSNIEYIDIPAHLRDRYQYFTQGEMTKLQKAGYTQKWYSLEEGVKDYVQQYLMSDDPYL
jgi:ADP-L-glycero-D-manno-heptose 6-epimerase